MSDAKRSFSGETFQEDISSQGLSLRGEHNYFGAKWLDMGLWLSLYLCLELSNTLAA